MPAASVPGVQSRTRRRIGGIRAHRSGPRPIRLGLRSSDGARRFDGAARRNVSNADRLSGPGEYRVLQRAAFRFRAIRTDSWRDARTRARVRSLRLSEYDGAYDALERHSVVRGAV